MSAGPVLVGLCKVTCCSACKLLTLPACSKAQRHPAAVPLEGMQWHLRSWMPCGGQRGTRVPIYTPGCEVLSLAFTELHGNLSGLPLHHIVHLDCRYVFMLTLPHR